MRLLDVKPLARNRPDDDYDYRHHHKRGDDHNDGGGVRLRIERIFTKMAKLGNIFDAL